MKTIGLLLLTFAFLQVHSSNLPSFIKTQSMKAPSSNMGHTLKSVPSFLHLSQKLRSTHNSSMSDVGSNDANDSLSRKKKLLNRTLIKIALKQRKKILFTIHQKRRRDKLAKLSEEALNGYLIDDHI